MKWFYVFFLIALVSCRKEIKVEPFFIPKLMEVPKGFPPIEFPENNAFSEARWKLGKKLFYDKMMSVDNSISCASCHHPEIAFSDEVSFSLGVEGRLGTRNSPSLANVAYHPYFTREGGVPDLEFQVLVPIQEHNEMDFNIVLIAQRMSENSTYVSLANDAYGQEPNAFVISRALATFERSLLSGYSAFDQYSNYNDYDALTNSQIRGMELFYSSKTNCATCHSEFNFTNYAFENNGLYEEYEDEGRFRLTGIESDRALFKVPSLRNIELTAPYMHDGSMATIEEVIEHYITGGEYHPNKSPIIQPLDLTNQEKSDLVNFLKSLTDNTFINNQLFSN